MVGSGDSPGAQRSNSSPPPLSYYNLPQSPILMENKQGLPQSICHRHNFAAILVPTWFCIFFFSLLIWYWQNHSHESKKGKVDDTQGRGSDSFLDHSVMRVQHRPGDVTLPHHQLNKTAKNCQSWSYFPPQVAIKTIKKSKIETEADLIRIRREIQIMSSVQHPNIIHIYEGEHEYKLHSQHQHLGCSVREQGEDGAGDGDRRRGRALRLHQRQEDSWRTGCSQNLQTDRHCHLLLSQGGCLLRVCVFLGLPYISAAQLRLGACAEGHIDRAIPNPHWAVISTSGAKMEAHVRPAPRRLQIQNNANFQWWNDIR